MLFRKDLGQGKREGVCVYVCVCTCVCVRVCVCVCVEGGSTSPYARRAAARTVFTVFTDTTKKGARNGRAAVVRPIACNMAVPHRCLMSTRPLTTALKTSELS